MKKQEETIFKNTVGRPTNEIKKKRKIFAFSIAFLMMAVVSVGVLMGTGYTMKKGGVSSKLFAAAANTSHNVAIQHFDSSTLPIGKTTGKFKATLTNPSDSVLVLSSNKSIIEVVKYGDNTASGNLWALKVKKPGNVTITAQAIGIVNGKKKIYATQKYSYVVKKHAISMKKFTKNSIIVGMETENFKINVSSPEDKVNLVSDKPSIVQIIKYGDNSFKNNLWALKVKKSGSVTITAQAYKTVNGKQKVYSTTKYTYTIGKTNTSQLYCVSDDNKTKLITEIEVNKAFRCYTRNEDGIKLSATASGLASGYSNTWATKKGDNWIKLKYSKTGSKLISAVPVNGKSGPALSIKVKAASGSNTSSSVKATGYLASPFGPNDTKTYKDLSSAKTFPLYSNGMPNGGIDLPGSIGTSIYAMDGGIVETATYDNSFGNYVVIDHQNGYKTLYAHLRDLPIVKKGEVVSKAQLIGYLGDSGATTAPHLRVELRDSSVYSDNDRISARSCKGYGLMNAAEFINTTRTYRNAHDTIDVKCASSMKGDQKLATGRLKSPFGPNDTKSYVNEAASKSFPLYSSGQPHGAIDIAKTAGTSVYAMDGGVVETAEYNDSFGNYIVIDHQNGYKTLYAALKDLPLLKAGQQVKQGQLIGYVGMTGVSTGPHLHIELQNTELLNKYGRTEAKRTEGKGLMNAAKYINTTATYVGQTK